MGEIGRGVAGRADVCEIGERWGREVVYGGWDWEEWDFQEHEILGIGRRELDAGGEPAGIDVPEIVFRLLSQLRARVLLLAPGDGLRLLLHLAGDFVLQGREEDLALAPQMPFIAGQMELRFPVVFFRSRIICPGLIAFFPYIVFLLHVSTPVRLPPFYISLGMEFWGSLRSVLLLAVESSVSIVILQTHIYRFKCLLIFVCFPILL